MRTISSLLLVLFCIQAGAQNITSGGKLKPEQAIMDIRQYTIALKLDIPKHSISGYTTITVNMLQPTRTLLFDLLDSFTISKITVNGKKQSFDYATNAIRINMADELPAGKATVTVWYAGQPHIAIRPPWDDGFTWTKDSTGNPWVAITAEGTGGKIFFPCKDHPSDEPNEGAELIITVPKGLVVAGPGLLQKVTSKAGWQTYDWKTNYTINNYSILFNVGKYKVVSREYTTVNGTRVPMQFYVLEEHISKAAHHLDVLEQIVRSREKYFGEYPWAREKIGICETPHLGMEHQTMNAYGNKFRYTKVGGQDFDWLMDHEFGHEWWGNKVTARDWADYWIHEGINSFGDALDIKELAGEQAYTDHFKEVALHFENKLPIIQGKDMDEEAAYVGDIYGKGAFFIHTLRYVLGDSIFFPAIKAFVTSPAYTYDNLVTTADLQQFLEQRSGIKLAPLFHLYLYTTGKLEINVKQVAADAFLISTTNMDLSLPLQVATSSGIQTITLSKKPIRIKSSSQPVIDPDKYYLTRVVME